MDTLPLSATLAVVIVPYLPAVYTKNNSTPYPRYSAMRINTGRGITRRSENHDNS